MSITLAESLTNSNATLTNSIPDNWVSMELKDLSNSLYNDDDNLLTDNIKVLKIKTLYKAIELKDYELILNYANSTEGLISNDLRYKIWPVLLNIPQNESSSKISDSTDFINDLNINDLPPHKDEDQVRLDIERSFVNMINSSELDGTKIKSEIRILRKLLFNLIVKILRNHPFLNYYQGYHDLASIVLLIFGKDLNLSYLVLEKLTLFHLRDFMVDNIQSTLDQLSLIPELLKKVDLHYYNYLTGNDKNSITPFYQSLSSILTFYSHDLNNYDQIFMIWDFVLSYNSVDCNVYLYIASLIFFKDSILQKDLNHRDTNDSCDNLLKFLNPIEIFSKLSNSELIKILKLTKKLMFKFPLSSLKYFNNSISEKSVLKNSSLMIHNYQQLTLKFNKFNNNMDLIQLFKELNLENESKFFSALNSPPETPVPSSLSSSLSSLPIISKKSYDNIWKLTKKFRLTFTVGLVSIIVACVVGNNKKLVGNISTIGLGSIKEMIYKI